MRSQHKHDNKVMFKSQITDVFGETIIFFSTRIWKLYN